MKEYQYRVDDKNRLPKEVYYQCVWIIRDMDRLEKIVANTKGSSQLDSEPKGSVSAGDDASGVVNKDVEALIEDAVIKLDCLKRALEDIPDYYRHGIVKSVKVRGGGFDEFAHENTWKKWKMRFMYSFAINMGLY